MNAAPGGRIVGALLLSALAATCTASSSRSAKRLTPSPSAASPIVAPAAATPAPSVPFDRLRVRLRRVVSMKDPVAMTSRPQDPSLYVADREGRVWAITGGQRSSRPVLDISASLTFGGDRGLLGAAFSPDGRFLYVSYIDHSGSERLEAYPWVDGRLDRSKGRPILTIPQPTIRHHGGDVHFGPDGDLWMTTGDGDETDPHSNAQNLGLLLGKLIRIDPTPDGRRPYRVPADNPFVHRHGARPEIYAYGLRNPWRFSFDRSTGDVWIGDVGQFMMEEIDELPAGTDAGANLGWPRLEGTLPYRGKRPSSSLLPVYEYRHKNGLCAVMGGYVYRGSAIPGLVGDYVYNDFCDAHLRALLLRGGKVVSERELGPHLSGVAAFGEGPDGELYEMSLFSGIYRIVPG